jgi:Rieske Fe-S protein
MGDLSRRGFIGRGIAGVAGAGACLCGVGGCATFSKIGDTPPLAAAAYRRQQNTLVIDLARAPELRQVGGSAKIVAAGVILARVGEKAFVAAALRCTHRGVELEYDHDEKVFECASLGDSEYRLDGTNIDGPATRPLQVFRTSLVGDKLTVKLGG